MNQEGEALKYLKRIFQPLNYAKIKEGIFVGPQNFDLLLQGNKKAVWEAFMETCKAENYVVVVTFNELLTNIATHRVQHVTQDQFP